MGRDDMTPPLAVRIFCHMLTLWQRAAFLSAV